MNRLVFLHDVFALGTLMLSGCRAGDIAPAATNDALRLRARPGAPRAPLAPGTYDLAAATGVAGQLFIPQSTHDAPRPLLLMLHGAGRSRNTMHYVFPAAEQHGVIAVTPQSAGRTWDMILGTPGVDAAALDQVLRHIFERCSIDPARIMLGGFSDGGSYALSLGLRNGDLFTHVAAFAPGFMLPDPRVGRPRVFISHGTADAVLPLATTGRPIRERLVGSGYDVQFHTFDGGHGVNLAHLSEALRWLHD